jgi:hypothetical protein
MTTRRRVLLGSGGLIALATAGPAGAETPRRITGRNAIMEISESALPTGARGSDSDSGNHGSNPGPPATKPLDTVAFCQFSFASKFVRSDAAVAPAN